MTYYITVDSFGSELPDNWEEISAFLNRIIDERGIAEDHEACNELWDTYWHGKILMMNEVQDFLADHYDDDDPLVLDGEPYVNDGTGAWTQNAHDSGHNYTLVDYDGNIQIVP